MPVTQRGSESKKFKQRRTWLYAQLGIPLTFLENKKVLEFGPGGGFNSEAIFSNKPKIYDFVEGSKFGATLLKKRLKAFQNTTRTKVYNLQFTEFKENKVYDLVIAEACIPGQDNPSQTIYQMSKFVRIGGILVVTNTSKMSMLSEILRNVMAKQLKRFFPNEVEWIEVLNRTFDSHLNTLGENRRSTQEWVFDNILHPWHEGKSDFTLVEALHSLKNFRFLNSSPAFFQNQNWYKNENCKVFEYNKRVEKSYYTWCINELDYRSDVMLAVKNKEIIERVVFLSGLNFDLAKNYLISKEKELPKKFTESLGYLENELRKVLPLTSKAIGEYQHKMSLLSKRDKIKYKDLMYNEFSGWFGRGQMYSSFVNFGVN
jgi:phospholipid N-methyltransferase